MVVTEEINVNLYKRVTMKHCFKEKESRKLQNKGKYQDGFFVHSRTEKDIFKATTTKG